MEKEKLRSEIDEKYKWDLTKFCKDDAEFLVKYEKYKTYLPKLKSYKGKLGDKKALKEFLQLEDESNEIAEDLIMYMSNMANEDLSNSEVSSKLGMLESTFAQIGAELAFITPELLSYDESYLKDLQNDKDFADYDFTFQNMLRSKAHILGEKENEILAKTGAYSDAFEDIMQTFFSTDLKCEDALDSKGEKHIVNETTYSAYLEGTDRVLRKNAFESFAKGINGVVNTMSKVYIASLKKDYFYANTAKFNTILEAKLYGDNIDELAYKKLIENAHSHIDLVRQYNETKATALGLKKGELQPYDRLAPISQEIDTKFSFEDCCKILEKVFAVLGQDYVDVFKQAQKERWFDVYPTKGKRTGAYENAVYSKSPIILLNHKDDYDSLSTIAHEFGHAMHSYFSNKTQCKEKAGYTIFLAEIASTTNEILLANYMLEHTPKENVEERKFYLDHLIKMFNGTFFRQAMFSEFEYQSKTLIEKNQPVGKDTLNKIYHDLDVLYMPAMKESDQNHSFWTYIPHFYYNYYVWQYATGVVSAINFASKILSGDEKELKNYKENFLSAGGRDFSLNTLKNAGIDLYTDEPYKVAFDFMQKYVDEFQQIVEMQAQAKKNKQNNELTK